MSSSPFFSVVIPTRNRPDLIGACVRSVLDQNHDGFELVLCDQSDGEATTMAAREAAQGDPRLVIVRASGRGRSRALNAGIPRCRGRWLVLTDDDCHPETEWLTCMAEAIAAAGSRAVIIGRVSPGPVGPGMAPPPAILDETEAAEFRGRVARDLIYPNFALPKEVIDELGLFDERMGVGTDLPGGEDNDYGYRLLRRGWRILYRPHPRVFHQAWRSPDDRAALKRDYGIGQGAFYAKHLARLDPFIAYRLVRDVVGSSRAATGALLRGWPVERRGHLAFLGGLFIGLGRMARMMARGTPAGGEV